MAQRLRGGIDEGFVGCHRELENVITRPLCRIVQPRRGNMDLLMTLLEEGRVNDMGTISSSYLRTPLHGAVASSNRLVPLCTCICLRWTCFEKVESSFRKGGRF